MITAKNTVANIIFILAGILCGFLIFGIYQKEMQAQKKIRLICLYGVWFFLLVIFGWLNVHRMDAIADYALSVEGMEGTISGYVYDIKQYDSYTDVYLKADSICAISDKESISYKGSTRILLRIYDVEDFKLGQKLSAAGTFAVFKGSTNPGGFDSRQYYKNKNIFLYCKDGSVISKSDSYNVVTTYLRGLKSSLSDIYDEIFSERHAGIIKTMLLGDKTDLDADIKREYRMNGIAHVLAISGLHIAMIGMWIFKRLRRLTGSYIISGIFAIIIIILYGIMTGLGTATFRAVIMLALSIISNIFGRTSDMLTSMGISCIILCMINPFVIRDAGFLLSFGAVFAIGAVAPILKCHKTGKRAVDKLVDVLVISISINLIITPIIIYSYYEFPLYGIIINLFVIPLVAVVLMFAIIAGFLGLVLSPGFVLVDVLALPARLVLDIYDILCDFFGGLPYSVINTGHISIRMMLIYYICLACILLGICRIKRSESRHIRACAFCGMMAAFLICVVSSIYEFKSKFQLAFLDVGQGDGILITTAAGTNILIDGGSTDNDGVGEYVLSPAIKYFGASDIDYVFLTHGDEDHVSGIRYLMEEEYTGITIENLVIARYGDLEGFAEIIELAEEKNINVLYMDTGDVLQEKGDEGQVSQLTIRCLYPNRTAVDELIDVSGELSANDLSLVLRMDYEGLSVLFTGDIGSDVESYLVENDADLTCDILKEAHHGSKYSGNETFLETCLPYYTIISCGLNNIYGHPHEELLERLESIGTKILRTDESGAIGISMEDGEIKLRIYGDGGS